MTSNGAGGIEPPSRDRRPAASTCVLGDLISTSRPPPTAFAPVRDSRSFLTIVPGCTARRPARCSLQSPHHQASCGDCEACIRPRERRDAQQINFSHTFYQASMLLDAPRQAFPIRSNPFRPQKQVIQWQCGRVAQWWTGQVKDTKPAHPLLHLAIWQFGNLTIW